MSYQPSKFKNEQHQDSSESLSSNPGHADNYGLNSLASQDNKEIHAPHAMSSYNSAV